MKGRSFFKRRFRFSMMIHPDTLAARILEQEHKIYPRAVQLFAEGRLRVEGRRVFIEAGKPEGEAVISPS